MSSRLISIIINADTRPASNETGAMFDGTRSRDYLIEGVRNKQAFLYAFAFISGIEIETILWVDEHEPVSPSDYEILHSLCDRLVISKHSKHYRSINPCSGFNDVNYLQALSLARGEWIAHFDQDMAAFVAGPEQVSQLFDWTNEHKFVCYPSPASPKCVNDPSFGSHIWASTRFFLCKKENLNLQELEEAIVQPETLYAKYGHPPKICNWTEHFLGAMAQGSVFYPPLSQEFLIFPWCRYKEGAMGKLNRLLYSEIAPKLIAAGAHEYHGVDADKLDL